MAYMKKVFKKYLDIHSRDKSDKIDVFDIVTSCSIFDQYIFSKNTFLCLVIEISIYEFEASKKCQVSLVVQYRSRLGNILTKNLSVKLSIFSNPSI